MTLVLIGLHHLVKHAYTFATPPSGCFCLRAGAVYKIEDALQKNEERLLR